jgi:hypothetical protein
MAIITQKPLFEWNEIEKCDELVKLELILKYLPDGQLIILLEKKRGKGRNKYSIRNMWNALIAGIVLGHETIESLRRELKRNPYLSQMCGFFYYREKDVIPTSGAFSRFLKLLLKHSFEVNQIFQKLVRQVYKTVPDFGENLAMDGKAIQSYAGKTGKKRDDNRCESDADWGKHVYSGIDNEGRPWEKIKRWFGFKLHLLIDSKYELPISFMATKASKNEIPVAHMLLDNLSEEKLERAKIYTGDRGLDDGKLHDKLWSKYGIKPVIDIRNSWKDPDGTKLVPGSENVVYDIKGTVSCYCPKTNRRREMAFGGFEQSRNCLKYRCPAAHYGYECKGKNECGSASGTRISLDTDRRIFCPIARSSYKWKRLYKNRTAVERVNSRIDNVYGFEKHTMRGMVKISLRFSMVFMIMLALAIGWIKEGKPERMRKLKTA